MVPKNPTSETKGFGDQYPPSRPTLMMFLVAAVVIAAIVVIMNWQKLATLTNFPQIRSTLGL
jgi:hypothetical protein